MGLDLSGNGSSETMYDEGDRNMAVVGYYGLVAVVWLTTEADDQSSRRHNHIHTDTQFNS